MRKDFHDIIKRSYVLNKFLKHCGDSINFIKKKIQIKV
jgi:hypothetical protein